MVMFGLRLDLRNPAFSGVDPVARFAASLDMAEWADRHGALFVSLSEHHGAADGYLPSPLTMAAAVAARTRQVRIMVNAIVVPFHDPLRLAEDAAVVDLLSGGRLDLTLAGGYVPEEFAMFGVEPAERPRRVTETVQVLRAAWTGEPFEFRGRRVRVTPRPARPGGPRIVLGGSSDAAARRAARIADGFLPTNAACWTAYRDECRARGRGDPGEFPGGGTEVVVLARDPESAWDELGPYFLHEANSYGNWRAPGDVDTGYRNRHGVAELRRDGQYRILTPEEYGAELEATGPAAVAVLHPMVGGVPPERAWEHLELFEALLD